MEDFDKAQMFSRVGGNGTTDMTMTIPVFEGEKWRRLDSNLHVCYRMAPQWQLLWIWPAVLLY